MATYKDAVETAYRIEALTCSCGHQRDEHQVWTASLMPEIAAHNPSVLPFYAGCMECDCLAFKR